MNRRHAPATDRNREPILGVLRRWLPESGHVLEIASGTGQHVAFLAPAFPGLEWQPTELDPEARSSIDAWSRDAPNIRPAIELDAASQTWPVETVDGIFCANMIHIAPIEACAGLLAGAGRVLRPGGVLLLYGPFRRKGAHTAPSNASFDESLRTRDRSWGIRDLETVIDGAAAHGLSHRATVEMPANNFTVVFRAGQDVERSA